MNDADWLRRRIRQNTRDNGGRIQRLLKLLKKLVAPKPPPPPR